MTQSALYSLERFDVGIVHLDSRRRVIGMNELARRTLPVGRMMPFDRHVLEFHPERAQAKVAFLLDSAATCPVANPPPMTMIINIPERVLLIKVSCLSDEHSVAIGYTLIFYDITDVVGGEAPLKDEVDQRRRLKKIPTASGHQLIFVDAGDVLHLHSDGHYTRVVTAVANRFCNLSIGDLEGRLDPEQFVRVHRSHIVNMAAIKSLSREGGRLAIELVSGGAAIPVSRTSANGLLARLGMPNTTAATRR